MPTPRRPILRQLSITTLTAVAAAMLYLYVTRPEPPRLPPRLVTDRLAAPTSVAFSGTRLSDALQTLSRQIGVTIAVDWKTLESLGLDADTPVTFDLAAASASDVLDGFLRGLPAQGDVVWAERDGQIVVSDDATANAPVVRIYDLAPLVKEGLAFSPQPLHDYPMGVGLFQSNQADFRDPPTQIMMLLQSGVDPRSWLFNGGRVGQMEYAMNRLVVAQTPANHAKIQRILIALGLRDATSVADADSHGSPP